MHSVDKLAEDAKALSEEEFVAKHGDKFLLKTPVADERWDQDMEYQTVFQQPGASLDMEDEQTFDASWRVAAIRKRPDNPFPDRISVGRAKSCDIVIRLSQISKLHAHFIVEPDGSLLLGDQKSANGTAVNGHRLQPRETAPVGPGDVVEFAQVKAQLVEGARLYQLLRQRLD